MGKLSMSSMIEADSFIFLSVIRNNIDRKCIVEKVSIGSLKYSYLTKKQKETRKEFVGLELSFLISFAGLHTIYCKVLNFRELASSTDFKLYLHITV